MVEQINELTEFAGKFALETLLPAVLILAVGLLATPASAAGSRFADIPDQTTATAVEVKPSRMRFME